MEEIVMTPSDFVAVFNQSVSIAFPLVVVEGEVSNFRIAKGKWVYFDIKDEYASLRVFGTVFQLTHPVEDGMLVRLKARPELHPLYNFSLQVVDIKPSGEGNIKKSFDLLFAKLTSEGIFDEARKRTLPYPPQRIGLITSSEAAAYGDFMKVLTARWPLLSIELADVRVQGDSAANEIVAALNRFNLEAEPVEVIVVIRGGGSADDLVAFSDEQLTRAIASSRVPTMVAIGHERDISLAELAADQRASTPSNAAELLVPSKIEILSGHRQLIGRLYDAMLLQISTLRSTTSEESKRLKLLWANMLEGEKAHLRQLKTIFQAYDPRAVLLRGFSLIRLQTGQLVTSAKAIQEGDELDINFHDGRRQARVIG